MYHVRFHLGRGANYMKWQVKDSNGVVRYYDPDSVRLVMLNAKLHNRPNVAKKICEGANKTVCAWVECEWVGVVSEMDSKVPYGKNAILYNPKKAPNWTNKQGENLDGKHFHTIISNQKFLFTNH